MHLATVDRALERLEAGIERANDRLDWIRDRQSEPLPYGYASIETIVGVVRALRGVKLGRAEG